jgi:glycerophosphoryl diester phosphodiesterase
VTVAGYYDFGGGPADYVVDTLGNALSGQTLTVWTARTGGSQIVDILTFGGSATGGNVTSESGGNIGRIRFQAPDTYGIVWVQGNVGDRFPMVAVQILQQVGTAVTNAANAISIATDAADEVDAAMTTAASAEARSIDALETANGARALADIVAASVGQGITVDDLGDMEYVPHRGGLLLAPENTMEAFQNAMHLGTSTLELDCHLQNDGSIIVMHDGTTTRTTQRIANTSGNSAHGVVAMPSTLVDAGTWFSNSWPSVRVPTLEQVFREFGRRVVMFVEAKNTGCGAAIVALAQKYGMTDSIVVCSFTSGELAAARAAGIKTQFLFGSVAGVDWAAYGSLYDRVGINHTSQAPDTWIQDAQAAGLKVDMYTLNRRHESQPWVDAGVDSIICNDPWYLKRSTRLTSVDGFAAQTWLPGMLAGHTDPTDFANRGKFFNNNRWGYDAQPVAGTRPDTSSFCLMGHMSPIPDPTNFTLTLRLQMPEAQSGGTSTWGSVYISTTDHMFDDSDSGADQSDTFGYHVLFRKSGVIAIFKNTGGTVLQVGTAAGTPTAIAPGTLTQFRIVVTPTAINVSRLDVVGATYSTTDTSYRGAYLHFGSFEAEAQFYEVATT